jgi:hypothetical protein
VNNFRQFIRQSPQLIAPALEIGLSISHLQDRIQKNKIAIKQNTANDRNNYQTKNH